MNGIAIPEIPRLYTALAEWGACTVFILANRRMLTGIKLVLFMAVVLATQSGLQLFAGMLPLNLWLLGMMAAVLMMFLYIFAACEMKLRTAIYYTAFAFIIAEFTASLEWQLHHYIFQNNPDLRIIWHTLFLVIVYAAIFVFLWVVERKRHEDQKQIDINLKQMRGAVIIAIITFMISNLSFVGINTPFSGRLAQEIFYIRTLVDFAGLMILYTLHEQYHQMRMENEIKEINRILHRHYEQYKHSKKSIDLINRKYHDLKHQIAVIRAEKNPDKKAEYLNELENGIGGYEAQFRTGNSVLDTILESKALFCQEHDIDITCVADGELLKFMDVMDLCTIMGNALDNAIESVLKLSEVEKRLIRIAIFSQNNLMMLRFENYFESELKREDDSFATTKKDLDYHGYGIKSLQYTAEKYNGTLTIHTDNNWFSLCILIPLTEQ